MPKGLKKVLKIIIDILTLIVFLILVVIIFAKVKMMTSNKDYFDVFGYSVFTIASGSMEPTLSVNDIIIVKKNKEYNVNDIVTCKVVKFAPFGAFVEIEKGLEGLVHNSQITSLKRITKPEEELELGQLVNAKILNIDMDNCKIGLTIKELEGTSQEYGYEEYINNK